MKDHSGSHFGRSEGFYVVLECKERWFWGSQSGVKRVVMDGNVMRIIGFCNVNFEI